MTDEQKTPAQLASEAAESVRALNHATRSAHADWEYPGDAYSVVSLLAYAAHGLQQSVEQTVRLISDLDAAGRIVVDAPADRQARVNEFQASAKNAINGTRQLSRALNTMYSALSPMAYRENES